MSQISRPGAEFRICSQVSDFDGIRGHQYGTINYYHLRMELEIRCSQDSKENVNKSESNETNVNAETVGQHQFIDSSSKCKLSSICDANGVLLQFKSLHKTILN